MVDVTPNEDAAKQLADMVQRVSMRIAEFPVEQREDAFGVAERNLRDLAKCLGTTADRIDTLTAHLMKGLRQMVLDLDVGGKPQGGNA